MARDLPIGFPALSEEKTISPILLCELNWPTGMARFWSGYGEIVISGDTFYGTGHLGSVTPIDESSEGGANGLVLTISGIPSEVITHALANDAQGRSGKLWLAALNGAGALVCDPYLIFDGLIDVTSIEDSGETANISVTLEKELVDRRTLSRRSTHEDQQIDHPGDLFFDYVAGLQDKEIFWGNKPEQPRLNALQLLKAAQQTVGQRFIR